MHKVKKLFLFLIPIICGDLGAACVSNDHNKVLIEEGSLINKDQPEIKFESAVFELDKLAGEPLEVKVNDRLISRGEVVVVNDRYAIRLTDVINPEEITK